MSQFRRQFTILRRATGTTVDGNWVEGATTQEYIQASLQPLKPEDMKTLDFGRRTMKVSFLFTDTKLDLSTTANPTIVLVDNEQYEVNKEEAWQNGVISHYKYMITREIQ